MIQLRIGIIGEPLGMRHWSDGALVFALLTAILAVLTSCSVITWGHSATQMDPQQQVAGDAELPARATITITLPANQPY